MTTIRLPEKSLEQLLLLDPAHTRRDWAKGRWDDLPDEQMDVLLPLFATGLLDAGGNVTARGREVIRTETARMEFEVEQAVAALEMRELDRLDAQLRRRPNVRQSVEWRSDDPEGLLQDGRIGTLD